MTLVYDELKYFIQVNLLHKSFFHPFYQTPQSEYILKILFSAILENEGDGVDKAVEGRS